MTSKETVDDIMADATAQRENLEQLERALQADIKAIDRRAFMESRSLTEEEKVERGRLRTSQKRLGEAYVKWAYLTAKRLDDSAEVATIKARIDAINLDLADDLERLKDVERYAEITAKIADGAVKIAGKIAKLVV